MWLASLLVTVYAKGHPTRTSVTAHRFLPPLMIIGSFPPPSCGSWARGHLTQGLVFKGCVHSAGALWNSESYNDQMGQLIQSSGWSHARQGPNRIWCRNKAAGSWSCTESIQTQANLQSQQGTWRKECGSTSLFPLALRRHPWCRPSDSPGWF